MSKKKTGEFEMSFEEQRLWNEYEIKTRMAKHYEDMSVSFVEQAKRAEVMFWRAVRGVRELPEYPVLKIKNDRKLIITCDKKTHEEITSRQAKRTTVIVDKK
jgi:hypothetical protein